MEPSQERIRRWIEEGIKKNAHELCIYMDRYFLTPVGAEPEDDDYFLEFIIQGKRTQEHDSFCSLEAKYRIPSRAELSRIKSLRELVIFSSDTVPTYLVNSRLYGR